jgi:hypothetical protein
MATGLAATSLIDETSQKTLEEGSHEKQDDFITGTYLHHYHLDYCGAYTLNVFRFGSIML